ncbi:M15 family metallopeptidase [Paludibacteraceae bacterium OttesenSCG-928-F17]|nr:M15 family metallopeptidase [Paludibacteraceae bacterium OttesenSCG-928-F17]
MYRLGSRSIKSLQGVHPEMVRLMTEAIKHSPVDFTITEGVRTMERQQELYSQGRTKPGNIVTNVDGVNKKSNHQVKADGLGGAVDLYPYISGHVQVNDVENLIKIGNHIKATAFKMGIKVSWGGDWKMKDYPHFELS